MHGGGGCGPCQGRRGAALCKVEKKYKGGIVAECLDAVQGLKFLQVFQDKVPVKEKPEVVKCSKSEAKVGDYTKITVRPYLA